MSMNRSVDRFGNPLADGLPYARGTILPTTADDVAKLKVAQGHIRRRRAELGPQSVYLLSGLERNLQLDEVDLSIMDDEIASALYTDEVSERGIEHLGGDPARHDVFVFNRLTAALLCAADVMIEAGNRVIGVSPRYSHPAVCRAVAHAGGRFTDVTGLDKYGTTGPRLGLLGGEKSLVDRIRARAYEMGIEARQMLYPAVAQSLRDYSPERVRQRVAVTKETGEALKRRLGGNRVMETPVIVQLTGDDILEMALERAGLETAPCVPIEATAGLAMVLLRDHGVISVHFAGLPPGTAAMMIKFLPPDVLERFGGPAALAAAVDDGLDKLAETLKEPGGLAALLLGDGGA